MAALKILGFSWKRNSKALCTDLMSPISYIFYLCLRYFVIKHILVFWANLYKVYIRLQ
jgi:hypothetical protein